MTPPMSRRSPGAYTRLCAALARTCLQLGVLGLVLLVLAVLYQVFGRYVLNDTPTWAESGAGPFSPVFVNRGFTLDFVETAEPFPVYHFCFRVKQAEFDAILARLQAAGIAYRSSVRGPMDMKVNTDYGGNMVYWNEPDGHQWEMLTVSYARQGA